MVCVAGARRRHVVSGIAVEEADRLEPEAHGVDPQDRPVLGAGVNSGGPLSTLLCVANSLAGQRSSAEFEVTHTV